MKLLTNIALILTAIVLIIPIGMASIIYTATTNRRKFVIYLRRIAIVIDVAGNVVGKYLLEKTLIQRRGYKFGRLETVSRVLGKNKQKGTLTKLGKSIGKLLNWIDNNHLENAIKNR